uniref:Uncharacterized protein n=1 Tax=virus sp. ctRTq15 TaxID=2828253 RepID=A0A8S5RBG6_9VIRU|nr:MAG TPA: hypothetical protein [virus sp. ctRTq15]DAJ65885.1 MAG TPA: hypothetical protein [Bacteriophage sp.]DAP37939.1 MAG TPA: hypothetical protein [Caudoviricetes sp.]DAO03013.1 MAG TPA: hypothetical protein [Bacteriophage sp.]DAU14587.1 MAG TPA: hypothetical protein [Caudoviricetes sp.]
MVTKKNISSLIRSLSFIYLYFQVVPTTNILFQYPF